MIALGLLWLTQWLKWERVWQYALVIAVLWAYGLMLGAQPSITRAVVMVTLGLIGQLLFRTALGANTLAAAALAFASAVFVSLVFVSLTFATFVLGPFMFALSAATESVRAAATAAKASKLVARKIARDRSATFLFDSRDLLSSNKKFTVLRFTPIISGR